MVFRIFISYSQDDFFAKAKKIRNYLSKLFPEAIVYIDQDKSKGKKWREKNDEELKKCNLMVLIITPAVLQSDEVKREIKIANEEKKLILPCKHDDLELSWKELPLDLGEMDGIEFEDDEVLKTRLYREIKKIITETKEELKVIKYGKGWGKTDVILDQHLFDIRYTTEGGGHMSILETKADRETNSLIFNTKCEESCKVELEIPRSLIDSKINDADADFSIIIDGEEVDFEEKAEKDKRVLILQCPKGAEEIELIGTEMLGIAFGKVSRKEYEIKLPRDSSDPKYNQYCIPEALSISEGEKVKWINEDTASHTVTSGTISGGPDGTFDSSLIMAGSSYEIIFEKKGKFRYFCMVHPWKECLIEIN